MFTAKIVQAFYASVRPGVDVNELDIFNEVTAFVENVENAVDKHITEHNNT
jgi:hypothetical protein